jgi:threonine/homoserine/homoserine lactone efflux protein
MQLLVNSWHAAVLHTILLFSSLTAVLPAVSLQGALQQLLAMRKYSDWMTSASGTLLVAGGTYTLLSRVLPQ